MSKVVNEIQFEQCDSISSNDSNTKEEHNQSKESRDEVIMSKTVSRREKFGKCDNVKSMMEFQRKIVKENKIAQDIKKRILMYNAGNDININNKSLNFANRNNCNNKRESPNIVAAKQKNRNRNDFLLFSSDNPNLLQRRKSQDGVVVKSK